MEGRLPHDDGSDEGSDQGNDIDCQLELKESSDVVINISSPLAGFDDGSKVIILNDDISSGVSNLSSGFHGESDISFLQGWGIVGTITSYGNNISELSETRNHDVFIVWSRSSQNLKLLSDNPHVIKVSNGLVLGVFAHDQNSLLGLLADKGSNVFIKLWALHADAFLLFLALLENSALLGDGDSSGLIVSSNHSNSNSCLIARFDGAWNLFSDDVLDTSNANKSVTTLFNLVDLAALILILMKRTTLIFLKVRVGESNSSESLFGIALDHVLQELAHLVIQNNLVTLHVQVVGASFKHDFRGSLNMDSLLVAVFSFVVVLKLKDS